MAMDGYLTPPHAGPTTPNPHTAAPDFQLATPISLNWGSPKATTPAHDAHIPLVQTEIDASLRFKRLQQDLLILTSFNDNSTLHWRPAWFTQGSFARSMWTLHNPPNVVTERLPNDHKGAQLFTRRMRRANDAPPQYIKSWDHWKRYCDLYGVPCDFLCKEQVQLMRVGLPRSKDGSLCTPPQYPLYPEPPGHGYYMLSPSVYSTHLPRRFRHVVAAHPQADLDDTEVIVVQSDGALIVQPLEGYRMCEVSKGTLWSYIPWTAEMEESCRPLTVKLRLWKEASDESRWVQ